MSLLRPLVVSLFIVKSKQALQSHTGQLYSGRGSDEESGKWEGAVPTVARMGGREREGDFPVSREHWGEEWAS